MTGRAEVTNGRVPDLPRRLVVVITTPGQDTALTIRNTLPGGRPGGVYTAVGVTVGQAIWTAASVGIGAVLAASGSAFAALKPGAAHTWSSSASERSGTLCARAMTGRRRAGRCAIVRVSALRQGLLSNISNPKMLAFFASLLPRFTSTF